MNVGWYVVRDGEINGLKNLVIWSCERCKECCEEFEKILKTKIEFKPGLFRFQIGRFRYHKCCKNTCHWLNNILLNHPGTIWKQSTKQVARVYLHIITKLLHVVKFKNVIQLSVVERDDDGYVWKVF